eukprot:8001852-Pyramimonas_sp.AAC.1
MTSSTSPPPPTPSTRQTYDRPASNEGVGGDHLEGAQCLGGRGAATSAPNRRPPCLARMADRLTAPVGGTEQCIQQSLLSGLNGLDQARAWG